jgi:hypothetical protein
LTAFVHLSTPRAAGVQDPRGGDLLVAEDPPERLVALSVRELAHRVVQLPGDAAEADEVAGRVVQVDPELLHLLRRLASTAT